MTQEFRRFSQQVSFEVASDEQTAVREISLDPPEQKDVQEGTDSKFHPAAVPRSSPMRFMFIIDGLIAAGIFFFIHFLKQGDLVLPPMLRKLFAVYLSLWLFTGWWADKFSEKSYRTPRLALQTIFRANGFLLYAVTFIVVIFSFTAFSRLYIFGSVVLLTMINSLTYGLWYWRHPSARTKDRTLTVQKTEDTSISLVRMMSDAIVLALAFFVMNYLKRDSLLLHPNYSKALVFAWGLWLLSGLVTRKFERRAYPNVFHFFAPYIKSFFLLVFTTSLLGFGLRLTEYSRLQIFGSYGLFIFFEALMVAFYWVKKNRAAASDLETVQQVRAAIRSEPRPVVPPSQFEGALYPVASRLKRIYLKRFPELYEFIVSHIDLDRIDMAESLVLSTHTPYNIEVVEDSTLTLFINLHRVNDFRYINRYFLTVHRKFYNGGYFVGCAESLGTTRKRFYAEYPHILAQFLYPFDFLFRRVMPKLPVFKHIYFFLSKGEKRVISRAELLGRLYFCGFRVIAVKEIDYKLYYIAQKVKEPSMDRNPTYGPLIRLQRVGFGGERIQIYKLRTMHPYSEYLQEYVYENYKLQDNGKFNNDFRLTQWGRIFRMLWIDELPQLINYLRGDLNLVGVRAISPHYFSLYPPDLQRLRIKFKPGLIPPYYADLPDGFDEIVESERRYLQQKLAHPIKTDWVYFWKAVYNIVFKNARSR